MENIIEDVQMCLQEMRSSLLHQGSVIVRDEPINTSLEARKKVLWHLDQLAAEVAGAQQHIESFQNDVIFSPAEKDRMQEEIVEGLRKKLVLEDLIKDYSYCLRRHFQYLVDDDYPVVFGEGTREVRLERREVVHEVLRQVELIDDVLEDVRVGLTQADNDVTG